VLERWRDKEEWKGVEKGVRRKVKMNNRRTERRIN
jgi:hypothetical protein